MTFFLRVCRDSDLFIVSGKLFHNLTACPEKDLSVNFIVCRDIFNFRFSTDLRIDLDHLRTDGMDI